MKYMAQKWFNSLMQVLGLTTSSPRKVTKTSKKKSAPKKAVKAVKKSVKKAAPKAKKKSSKRRK